MSGERKIDRRFCKRIDQVEAQAEVDRLLSDPLFQSPDRNKSFLRFIANEFFEGRAEAIKAYAIAVDVFGRPSNFDPSIDPIVRIEATRLRAALTQYYDVHGSDTGIRVDLPRGRYVPVFSRMTPNTPGNPRAEEADLDVPDHAPRGKERSGWRIWSSNAGFALAWVLVGCGVATYALTVGFSVWKQGAFTYKPFISITMTTGADTPEREAEKVRDYLMVAISQFQTVRLASSDDRPETVSAGKWTGPTLASSLRGQRAVNDYQIVLKYEADGSERLVWWQVKGVSTGEVLQSGVERTLHGSEAISSSRSLASDLARTLTGTQGVINTIETLRDLNAPSLGNGCILRAIAAVSQGDERKSADARSCLERTLIVAPNDAGAKAELAIVLLTMDSVEAPTELSARAHKLASEAVLLAPFSDRGKYALMISQFRAGQVQAAIETGYAAMALNPNNSDIIARLGLYLFTAGRWEEGAGLASRSARMESNVASDVLLTRALNAYRLGRFEDALMLSQQAGRPEDYVVNAVQAAAAGQLDRMQDARIALNNLGAGRVDFEVAFRKNMGARHFTSEMIGLLEAGVLKATAQKS